MGNLVRWIEMPDGRVIETRGTRNAGFNSQPVPVLEDKRLYYAENGAVLHGRCCGATARFTGRDLNGEAVEPVDIVAFKRATGRRAECETCAARV